MKFDQISGRFETTKPSSNPEDGGSMELRNVGILPQHYTASKPSTRLEV